MAEAAGLAIGIIGLCGLFNNAVDCFEYVQIGRGFGRDFQTSLLKLDVARLRLTRWGESVGLGSALDEVQSLESTVLSAKDIPLAERILGQILDLFADAERVSKRFQQNPSSQKSLAVHSTADLNPVPALLHQKIRDIAITRQGRIGLREKAKWALYEEKQLSRLIEDVRDLVNDLVGLVPAVEVQRRLCEAEISGMGRETDLALLRDAAAGQDKLLSDAIKKAVGLSPTSYNVTFSGHNNSGFQLGINTGTPSQNKKRCIIMMSVTLKDNQDIHGLMMTAVNVLAKSCSYAPALSSNFGDIQPPLNSILDLLVTSRSQEGLFEYPNHDSSSSNTQTTPASAKY